MQQFILIIHIIAAVALVGLVLIQQGKGADTNSAFGAGASQSIFGSHGSASFLVKATAILAGIFFLTSIALNYFSPKVNKLDTLLMDSKEISKPIEETNAAK
ncbi:MAG: hypothetical protein LEGION0398_MBIBDBAK_00277 [Legionellaceae bacterium]